MLDLTDDWVWDFWTVDDGSSYHLFFLKAPRSLGNPDLRHWNASVGHAVSDDLRQWVRVDDALHPQPRPAFDDLATWTGSAVRAGDGTWLTFSTGLSSGDEGLVQRLGVSSSDDLVGWRRDPRALLEADERWYAVRGPSVRETHWRDPWVERAADGRWHMYVTSRAAGTGSAVVGHASSPDLLDWEVHPPLSPPSRRFTWAEVISLHRLEGRWVLLFSCLSPEMVGAAPGAGGVWAVPVGGPGAPVDLDRATRVTSEDLYVGKLVRLRDGSSRFLAFENRDAAGRFSGGVIDPVRVEWRGDRLGLLDVPERWQP